jgi:predicted dehydrogenase
MRIAIVGCGYVADYYMGSLANYPQLQVAGVMDRDEERAVRFAKYYGLPCYVSLQELLDDDGVDLVLNLTNPGSHFEITRTSLEAGKHVYSEKPLAMSFEEAQELARLAEERGLALACAPCSVLGETAQTIWRALREQRLGTVRLVFAELSGGPVHLTHPEQWRSVSGTPWPYQDEFQVGATLEHAAYYVSWLVAFFGPATHVTSFATCLVPDKGVPLEHVAPDLTVGCIQFASGVVARLTCDIFAPSDHSLRIIGDGGVLSIKDCWNYGSPVYIRTRTEGRADQLLATAKAVAKRSPAEAAPPGPPLSLRLERHHRLARLSGLGPKHYPLVRTPRFKQTPGASKMDYARGIQEMALSMTEHRPSRMSSTHALHVNEIVLAIQNASHEREPYRLTTTVEPMVPMPWAMGK